MDSFTFQKTPLVLLPFCISKFQGLLWVFFTLLVWWKVTEDSSLLQWHLCHFTSNFSQESKLGVSKLIWNSVVSRLSISPKRGFPSLFNTIFPSSRFSLLSATQFWEEASLSYLNPNGTKSTNMENTDVLVLSCSFRIHQSSQSTTDIRFAAIFT